MIQIDCKMQILIFQLVSLKHVDKSNLPAHFDNHQMVQEKSERQEESIRFFSFQQGKENTWITLSQEQGENFLTNVSKEQEDVPICQEEEDTWTVSLSNSTQISPLEIRKGKFLQKTKTQFISIKQTITIDNRKLVLFPSPIFGPWRLFYRTDLIFDCLSCKIGLF